MPNTVQHTPAPAPTKTEFDTLAEQIGKRQNITSNCTWNASLTFLTKLAVRTFDFVTVNFTLDPSGFSNGDTIVTLPSNMKAYGIYISMGVIDYGNGVPATDNIAKISIADNSNEVKLIKTTPNTGYVQGSITYCIR